MSASIDNAGIARQLRQNWLYAVSELADLDLQRQTWLDTGNANPHWSYIEFCESYPDEDQLLDGLKHCWLTKDEFKLLTELGRVLSSHKAPEGDDYDNAAILGDPAWHRVVKAAERAKKQLLSVLDNPSERQILLGQT